MNSIPRISLRYWTWQLIGAAIFALIAGALTLFIMVAAIVQASPAGYLATLMSMGITGYWAWLQYFIWRTQAWSIDIDDSGLSGKPLLHEMVELHWGDIVQVAVTRAGYFMPPQVEIRSQSGAYLRVSYMFPKLDELLGIIRERAPQSQIMVPPVPPLAIPDSWKQR